MTPQVAQVLAAMILLAAFVPTTARAAEPASTNSRSGSLDLLFTNGDQPERLELRVEIDGQSIAALWDQTFTQLLTLLDRDRNGTLDQVEAGRVPSSFALRSTLWGQFAMNGGAAPDFAALDENSNAQVSAEELADYYRRAGLGRVVVGIGRPTATDQLTAALLGHLDINQSGHVEAAEWNAAAGALRKLDANDDELIGPGELVARTSYPGATGSILLKAPTAASKPDPISDGLPFIILPPRTDDTQWLAAVAARRHAANLQPAAPDVLTAILGAPPAASWQIRLGDRKTGEATLSAAGEMVPVNGWLTLSRGNVRLHLRHDNGKLPAQITIARKQVAALLAEGDANSDGTVDETELGTPKAKPLQQLATIADQNSDGKLTSNELTQWLDLQERIAKGLILLTVFDHGSGLFELLDEDHDGSLGVRELKTAGDRLKAAGCITDGQFDRTALPRQLIATISHGHPLTMIGKPVRRGPDWFQAMDRNGDGYVSQREFSGTAATLGKLDLDQDGFISENEAEKPKN